MAHDSKQLQTSYLALVEFLLLSKRQIIDIGNDCDLTAMQAMTLFLLETERPMHFFKKVFNCDASNVTGLVDGLEQKGLANRIEQPQDRRIKLVHLAPKGRNVRAALLSRLTGPDSFILNKLTDAEISEFIRLIQKITA